MIARVYQTERDSERGLFLCNRIAGKEKQNMLKILTAILISGILMIDISSVDTKEVDVIICLKQKWRNVYRSQRYEVQSQTMVIRYP